MADFLTFDRANSQVITIDSLTGETSNVGAAFSDIVTTSTFPRRTQNLHAVFNSDTYNLALRTDNTVIVHKFDGTSWVSVFQSLTGGGGQLKPLGLHVANDRLVALWLEMGGSGAVRGASTNDGVNWTSGSTGSPLPPDIDSNALSMPGLANGGGHSIEWNGAVFFCTDQGISYFKPTADTFGPIYDDGGALVAPATSAGCFARWQTNLYFIKPATPLPILYKLTKPFDPASDPAAPQLTNQSAIGFIDPGVLTVGPDSGMYSLFVTKNDELSLFYSGANGTFFAKTTIVDFPAFQDQGSVNFPVGVSALVDAGVSLLDDDRRLTNPVITILANDVATGDLRLLDVSGTNVKIKAFLANSASDLMFPQSQRSTQIYMAEKPAISISSVNQLFPGKYEINYVLYDVSSRLMDILPEFTKDGVMWNSMSEADGGDGTEQLSASPSGESHVFNWDARQDLNGTIPFQNFRIVTRIVSV